MCVCVCVVMSQTPAEGFCLFFPPQWLESCVLVTFCGTQLTTEAADSRRV